MQNRCFKIVCCVFIISAWAWASPAGELVEKGLQPQLSMDATGVVRLVFGRTDSIFCQTSTDEGRTFSKPVFVGRVANMHLGTTRGPQLASSAHYSIITAIDKSGNIHWFRLTHANGRWQYGGLVNDLKASALEGLMGLAADAQDHFYAVWLDVRKNQRNNICFSSLSDTKETWAKNRLVYTSPDGHVCECCKPNIAVNGAHVAIQYRNWLQGARDLYLITSSDNGRTFGKAQKLGTGTWKLNACPMDGGGVVVDNNGGVQTVWQRAGIVYYCRPGTSEIELSPGRSCSFATGWRNDEPTVLLQQDNRVKTINLATKKETDVGNGNYLKAVVLPNGEPLCAWEENGTVHVKTL